MCLLGLAAMAKVYSANNVTLPNCCGTVIDLLIANIALIQKLFANQIKLMTQGQNVGAIYGGKYLANGTVDPNATTDKGVYMDALGEFKASNGQFSGNVISDNFGFGEGWYMKYIAVYDEGDTGEKDSADAVIMSLPDHHTHDVYYIRFYNQNNELVDYVGIGNPDWYTPSAEYQYSNEPVPEENGKWEDFLFADYPSRGYKYIHFRN